MIEPAPADWYPGTFPSNIECDRTAYVGSSFSFRRFRSERAAALRVASHATVDDGATLDIGSNGTIEIGSYAIVGSALFICDVAITIGDYAMIAWDAIIMDSYRGRPGDSPRPVRIGRGAWIGLGACVLPGVTIGEGTIVGARAVVGSDLPAFVVAAGNPARIVRRQRLPPER